MLQPFPTFFTFFHRKIRFLLSHPRIMDMMINCCRRRRPKMFSSNSDTLISSFVDLEVSNQFKQVFKLIDANGDGKISTTELSEVLSCLGYKKHRAAKEAEGMVKELDLNGDGFIDLDEFMVVMNDMEGKTGSGKEEEEEEEDEYLMDAFLVFDTDKNGLISAKELQAVLFNLGCDKCSLRDCKRMIKGVDKNGDGFVDFHEFRSMMKTGQAN